MSRLCADKTRLIALHVNHGLHESSDVWSKHCADTAGAYGVEAISVKADAPKHRGESIETWARRCRYTHFANVLAPNDLLLTAHHRDDVVETFLLQLLRGAGPHGLSGIASHQPFAAGTLVRPLLSVSREQILQYARFHQLVWTEDPSNADTVHNRNYIRHEIIPALERRWPAAAERISHAVDLQRETVSMLDDTVDEKITMAHEGSAQQISIDLFSDISPSGQRWMLKRWIARASYPNPDSAHLEQMLNALNAGESSNPCVNWKGAQLRRYRKILYLTKLDPDVFAGMTRNWDPHISARIGSGELTARQVLGRGLSADSIQEQQLIVKFRRGGERCHPIGRAHSQTLKRLFQHWGVPPWLRDRTPIIYLDGQIAAIAGLCVCSPFGAAPDELGWEISWRYGG